MVNRKIYERGGGKGLQLESVVPWGRSMGEYVSMFGLSDEDLDMRILDCGGGPASFNAEMSASGRRVVSCDPIYQFSTSDIARRIEEIYPVIISGVEAEQDRFVWTYVGSPARLGEVRMKAMHAFLEDFDSGLTEGRYVAAGLPSLPFATGEFDLALSSHFLFLYSDQFSTEFHIQSIREMLRVASEARIFPLLDMAGKPSLHLPPLLAELKAHGYGVQVRKVGYEFQAGGDQLLRVYKQPHRNTDVR